MVTMIRKLDSACLRQAKSPDIFILSMLYPESIVSNCSSALLPARCLAAITCISLSLCCCQPPAFGAGSAHDHGRFLHHRNHSNPVHHPAANAPSVYPQLSPLWAAYDEIKLVVDRHVMATGPFFEPAQPLTAGIFVDSLQKLRGILAHEGRTDLPPMPGVASRAYTLSRQQAVNLLVLATVPRGAVPTWSPEVLSEAVLDFSDVAPNYQKNAALAAERFYLPNPLRPADPADRAFGASILARALPWGGSVPSSGPFVDEIRKALSIHLLYADGEFNENATVTTAEVAHAILRARTYLPHDEWIDLPDMPVTSANRRPLTRAEVISLAVQGLVDDSRLSSHLASANRMVDSDTNVALAIGPTMYLAPFDDHNSIPGAAKQTIAVATYKGWLPNLPSETGKVGANALATRGYLANILARAVVRPGDYTGIIIDMSRLKPLARAGGMWVMNAGLSTTDEVKAQLVYPYNAHAPVRPFFSVPGALAYYGDEQTASMGRAGAHPYVVHALDWAQYDWTNLHGPSGLRRGGGLEVPLNTFHFVHGTPPIILISPDDAQKMIEFDHTSLLLRRARVALVQPNFSMTAMR